MTCWINREAERELRRFCLEEASAAGHRGVGIDYAVALSHVVDFLDSMPVTDAGDDEAEAALDEVEDLAVSFASDGDVSQTNGPTVTDVRRAASTIRARLRAARASHTPEEIEAAHAAADRLFRDALTAEDPVEERDDGPSAGDDLLSITRLLPPRPEPAAKPESIIAEASGTHVLERTSRKGHPFVGRCSGCGVEGPASLAREKCPAAKPKETP